MGTRQIPVIIMLIGGSVSCAASLIRGVPMRSMLTALIITLIAFYILGHIIRIVVNKFFVNILDPEAEESEKTKEESLEESSGNESEDADTKQDADKASEQTHSEDEE
ncbi:MAG: threonine/serine exporter family protein [Eubacterium sp.]|jgi:fructose-specific phosphotransferase system IIC component|nr:threonine/serine exporter family protein [Eubacterium sp.]